MGCRLVAARVRARVRPATVFGSCWRLVLLREVVVGLLPWPRLPPTRCCAADNCAASALMSL